MTARQWMKANVGKKIDMDGYPPKNPYQCVDVIKKYYKEIIGINPQKGNAIDYWTTFPAVHFTRIKNTPAGIPPVGSILIWSLGKYGHIGVVYSANVNQFETFEQNWSATGLKPTEFKVHSYSSVLGWLIPKKDVNTDWTALEAARKAAEEAALIAKQAKDARIAKEAAEVARKAQEEADRLAAEKAEVDRIQKEEVAKEKAEAEKQAKEQEKLEAELKAKQEAEAKAEVERKTAEEAVKEKPMERLKSPVIWMAVLAQVGVIVGLMSPEIADTVKIVGTAILEVLTVFGILNNPTDPENF